MYTTHYTLKVNNNRIAYSGRSYFDFLQELGYALSVAASFQVTIYDGLEEKCSEWVRQAEEEK